MKKTQIDLATVAGIGSIMMTGILAYIFKREDIVVRSERSETERKLYVGTKYDLSDTKSAK